MRNNLTTTIILVLLLSLVGACSGGGGGTDSGGGTPAKRNQAVLSVSQPAIAVIITDSVVIPNVTGGSGSGALSYSSSDTSVVTVDATTGEVSIVGDGTATITITKQGDATYNAAATRYTVEVSKLEQDVLSFSAAEVSVFVDENPAEPQLSGGSGTGSIGYASSDTSVAVVDPVSGELSVVAAGTAEITAVKAEDNVYREASTSYSITFNRYEQASLVFDLAEVTGVFDYRPVSNGISGGSGTGVISYTSSQESVAMIDSVTGEVTLAGSGSTNIVATKAADATYLSQEATYAVHVYELIGQVSVDLGKASSLISWESQTDIVDIYRFTNAECDIEQYSVCDGSNLTAAVGTTDQPIEDSFLSRSIDGFLQFESLGFRSSVAAVGPKEQPFSDRWESAMAYFNGKLWLTGGMISTSPQDVFFGDVWSSEDGVNWNRDIENAAFGARADHQMVAFNDRLFLFGGSAPVDGGRLYSSDIWTSADGITWEQISTPYIAYDAKIIVFNDKLWAIGGGGWSGPREVWSSTDGVSWERELEGAPFGGRQGHAVAEHDGRLYLYGGLASGDEVIIKNDIWSSSDGINWVEVTADSGFTGRMEAVLVSHDDQLWVVGGHSNPSIQTSIYKSSDGITWTWAELNPLVSMSQSITYAKSDSTPAKHWLFSGNLAGDGGFVSYSENFLDWYTPVTATLSWAEN